MTTDDNAHRCEACDAWVTLCETCGGEGYGAENEFECDWINYGDDWVSCPDCHGCGIRRECAEDCPVASGEWDDEDADEAYERAAASSSR